METAHNVTKDHELVVDSLEGDVCSNSDKETILEADQAKKIFISHTIVRKPIVDSPNRSHLLIYVQDSQGQSKLAVVGRDSGSSELAFESQDLGLDVPALQSTDVLDVMNWLEELGAGEQAAGAVLDLSTASQALWTASGESRNMPKKRPLESSKPQGTSKTRRMAEESLESESVRDGECRNESRGNHGRSIDMNCLVQWIDKEATTEEVEKFRIFAEKLDRTIMYDCDTSDPMCTTRKGIMRILRSLENHPVCLSLLEASCLPKHVARLARHENRRVSELANRIRSNWQTLARNALIIAQELSKAGL